MSMIAVRSLGVLLAILSSHHAAAQCIAMEWDSHAGLPPDDLYGLSVAVGGGWMMVGAPLDDELGPDAGAVYVYRRSGADWEPAQKLFADDASPDGDGFGVDVDISGNRAVISAVLDGEGAPVAGAAYIFVESGGQWTQEAKLIASDAGTLDQIGLTVAIDGDTAVIGGDQASNEENGERAGAAYVFVRDGSSWTEQARLIAVNEFGQPDGAENDWFGKVGLSGNTIVVGADQDDDFGNKSGSAYVFHRTGEAWDMVQKLHASDAAGYDEFGNRISVSGDRVLIGANTDDNDENGHDAGSAYVFHFNGSTWVEEDKLLASDGADDDQMASGVALHGDLAVVGAKKHTVPGLPFESGQAYVFARVASSWVEIARLRPLDASLEGHFGCQVDVSDDAIAVGALFSDLRDLRSGSAYAWGGLGDCNGNGELDLCDVAAGGDQNDNGIPDECECEGDIDGNGSVGLTDLVAVLAAWGPCPGCPEDLNGDGTVGLVDLVTVLSAWGPCAG